MAITHADVPRLPGLTLPDFSGLKRILGHRRNRIGLSILIPCVTLAIVAPWLPLQPPLPVLVELRHGTGPTGVPRESRAASP